MLKVFITIFVFCSLFLQSSSVGKKSEREFDGFVGPVKSAFEEWSPISGYQYPSNARCRNSSKVYDQNGRLIQSSLYPGACGSDEIREHYTYDQEGNRTERTEEFQGKGSPPPPPPPMPPLGANGQVVKGPPKTTFKYDANGRMTEKVHLRANGDPTFKNICIYDEKGRPQERQVIHSDGTRYRWTYKYEGEKRFPESQDSFDGDSNKPSYTVTYSDYELNAQGDWVKRKETTPKTVSIHYQKLEYYPVKK